MNLDKYLNKDTFSASTTRGLVSGFLGGLAGTAVKYAIEQLIEVRKVDEKSQQIQLVDELAEQITGSPVEIENEAIVEKLVNVPLGCFVGATYGFGKKDKEETNIVDGVVLGATTWASTHDTTLPLMGLERSEEDIPVKIQLNELLSHVLFGVTTELVRSYVNGKMKEMGDETEPETEMEMEPETEWETESGNLT